MLLVLGQKGNLARRFALNSFHSIDCSPCDSESLESILKSKRYEAIVYTGFASQKQPNDFMTDSEYADQALGRLEKCLNVVRSSCLRKANFIYCSSAAVYGEGYSISEDSPVALDSIYSQVKYQAELLCSDLLDATPVNVTIARIFNIYGGYDSKSIVARLLSSIKDKSILQVANRGSSIRDFIHVDDGKHCLETVNYLLLFRSQWMIGC